MLKWVLVQELCPLLCLDLSSQGVAVLLCFFFLHLSGAAADLDELFHWLCNLSGAKVDLSSTTWCLHNLSETLLFRHAICLGPRDFTITFHFFSTTLQHIECVSVSVLPSCSVWLIGPQMREVLHFKHYWSWYTLTYPQRQRWAYVPSPVPIYSRLGLTLHLFLLVAGQAALTFTYLEFRQPMFLGSSVFWETWSKSCTHLSKKVCRSLQTHDLA